MPDWQIRGFDPRITPGRCKSQAIPRYCTGWTDKLFPPGVAVGDQRLPNSIADDDEEM